MLIKKCKILPIWVGFSRTNIELYKYLYSAHTKFVQNIIINNFSWSNNLFIIEKVENKLSLKLKLSILLDRCPEKNLTICCLKWRNFEDILSN